MLRFFAHLQKNKKMLDKSLNMVYNIFGGNVYFYAQKKKKNKHNN